MEVNETAKKYKKQERKYTYADYADWDDGNRYELIDGEVYMMSAPSIAHQRVIRKLLHQLTSFLIGKSCEVFCAPVDVCLNALGDSDSTVVQPDIIVVCDQTKLDTKRCNGAPDMVVEILSPSTARHDRMVKFQQYQKAGVREYWIVDPDTMTLSVHILENSRYIIHVYSEEDKAPVHVLEGCEINLAEVLA